MVFQRLALAADRENKLAPSPAQPISDKLQQKNRPDGDQYHRDHCIRVHAPRVPRSAHRSDGCLAVDLFGLRSHQLGRLVSRIHTTRPLEFSLVLQPDLPLLTIEAYQGLRWKTFVH